MPLLAPRLNLTNSWLDPSLEIIFVAFWTMAKYTPVSLQNAVIVQPDR